MFTAIFRVLIQERVSAAERLRAYVRERVKPTGAEYKRGTAARLAEHLQGLGFSEDAGWISAYADPAADPQRNASVDVALAMCQFFVIDLSQFIEAGPVLSKQGSTLAPSTRGGPADAPLPAQRAHLREITVLKSRIKGYEIALGKVRDAARDIGRIAAVRGKSRTATRRRA